MIASVDAPPQLLARTGGFSIAESPLLRAASTAVEITLGGRRRATEDVVGMIGNADYDYADEFDTWAVEFNRVLLSAPCAPCRRAVGARPAHTSHA